MSTSIDTFRTRAGGGVTARQGADCGTLTVTEDGEENGGEDEGGPPIGIIAVVIAIVAVALSGGSSSGEKTNRSGR